MITSGAKVSKSNLNPYAHYSSAEVNSNNNGTNNDTNNTSATPFFSTPVYLLYQHCLQNHHSPNALQLSR